MIFVIFAFLGVLLLAMTVLLSVIPMLMVPEGILLVLTVSVCSSAVMALISAALAFTFSHMEFAHPRLIAALSGLVVFAAGLILPVAGLLSGHQDADFARQISPVIREYGLEHFDEIDINRNALIEDGEIESALRAANLDDPARQVLEYMKSHQSDVGHVTPVIYAEHVYVISRSDLETLPERMKEKWSRW